MILSLLLILLYRVDEQMVQLLIPLIGERVADDDLWSLVVVVIDAVVDADSDDADVAGSDAADAGDDVAVVISALFLQPLYFAAFVALAGATAYGATGRIVCTLPSTCTNSESDFWPGN